MLTTVYGLTIMNYKEHILFINYIYMVQEDNKEDRLISAQKDESLIRLKVIETSIVVSVNPEIGIFVQDPPLERAG